MSETKTYRILFQGDSITDVGRARNDPRNMGQGYPVMVAGELGLRFPGKYEFINPGHQRRPHSRPCGAGSARISSI